MSDAQSQGTVFVPAAHQALTSDGRTDIAGRRPKVVAIRLLIASPILRSVAGAGRLCGAPRITPVLHWPFCRTRIGPYARTQTVDLTTFPLLSITLPRESP